MNLPRHCLSKVVACTLLFSLSQATAQDWPQWRGANRDGKSAGFKAPASWPKELSRTWKATVGDGVATPALVGDRLYVFARQEGREVTRCLQAATGQEVWKDEYDSLGAQGPASSFSGPRCSPTVAAGKVVTLGVRGVLSCFDAASGKLLWRKDDFAGAWPRFFTSSSPIVADNLCIAQLGGGESGGIVAYGLQNGDEAWRWTGDGPAYASPVLATVDGTKLIVAQTETKIVALQLTDGALAWEMPFTVQGRGYNAATPIVDGQMLIVTGSGRGATALRLKRQGQNIVSEEVWKNPDNSVQFNSPVLKDGRVYGLTASDQVFCLDGKDGSTLWTSPLSAQQAAPPSQEGGRRRRGGGRGGFGSVVDAGSVLMALTPAAELVVFAPDASSFKELARIKVADSPTHAHPVPSGNRILVKDQDSVILWTLP
jgi:outer membrane protein assembly factor BamB